jgi:hypothetical protein
MQETFSVNKLFNTVQYRPKTVYLLDGSAANRNNILNFSAGNIIDYFSPKANIGTRYGSVHDKVEAIVLKVSAGAGSIDGSTGDRFGAMCNIICYISICEVPSRFLLWRKGYVQDSQPRRTLNR